MAIMLRKLAARTAIALALAVLLTGSATASEPRMLLPPRESVSYAVSEAVTTRIWDANCLNWSSLGNTTAWQCWDWANTSRSGVNTYLFDIGQYGLNVTERDEMRLATIIFLNTTLIRSSLTATILDFATPEATEKFNNGWMYLNRNATQAEIGEFKTELADIGFAPQKGGGRKGGVWNTTNNTVIGPELRPDFIPLGKREGRYRVGNHSINWTVTSTPEWTAGTLYQLTESGGNITLSGTNAPLSAHYGSPYPSGLKAHYTFYNRSNATYETEVGSYESNRNLSTGFNNSRLSMVAGGIDFPPAKGISFYGLDEFSTTTFDLNINPNGTGAGDYAILGHGRRVNIDDAMWGLSWRQATSRLVVTTHTGAAPLSDILTPANSVVANDSWYQVRVVTSTTGAQVYINGTLQAEGFGNYSSAQGSGSPSGGPDGNLIVLGWVTNANNNFGGLISDFAVFNTNQSNTFGSKSYFGSFQSPVNDTSINLSAGEGYVLLNYSLVSAQPANTNITIQMNSSMDGTSWTNRSNVTLYTTTGQLGNTTTVSLANVTARLLQYNATFSIDAGSTSPTLDSLVIYMTRQPNLSGATWNRTWSNAKNWSFFNNSTAATDLDVPPTGYTLFVGNNSSDFGGVCRSSFASNNSPVNCTVAFPFGDNANHTLSARITDVDGNDSNTTTFTVAADNEHPNSSFAYPFRNNGSNATYNLSSLTVLTQVNLHENRSRIEDTRLWVNVSGVADNVSVVSAPRLSYNGSGPTLTLPWEGYYFARMWVNDSVGWFNETNVTFLVDLPPTLNNTIIPGNPQIGGTYTICVDVGENYSKVENVIFSITAPVSSGNFSYTTGQVNRANGTDRYGTYCKTIITTAAGLYFYTFYARDNSTLTMNSTTASFYIAGVGGVASTPAAGGGGGGGGGAPMAITTPMTAEEAAARGLVGLEFSSLSVPWWIAPWAQSPSWYYEIGATRQISSCSIEPPFVCKVAASTLISVEYTPSPELLQLPSWEVNGTLVVLSLSGDAERMPIVVGVTNFGAHIPTNLGFSTFPGEWLLFHPSDGKIVGINYMPPLIITPLALLSVGGAMSHAAKKQKRMHQPRRASKV